MTNSATLELINHAASQNDRWLMVAMVFTLVLCAGFCVRWLAGALERMEAKGTTERNELMAAHALERKERFEAMKKLQEETNEVLKDNTHAFTRSQEVHERVLHALNTISK